MKILTVLRFRLGISCLAIASLAVTCPAKSATTAYYRFETDNGAAVSNGQAVATADDSSANGNAGTAVGSLNYATTPFPNPVLGNNAANHFALQIGASHGNSETEGILINGSSKAARIYNLSNYAFGMIE